MKPRVSPRFCFRRGYPRSRIVCDGDQFDCISRPRTDADFSQTLRLVVDLGVGLWAWPLPMDFDGDGDSVVLKAMGLLVKRKLAGHTTSPATVDWNHDGVPELLLGAEGGRIYHLQREDDWVLGTEYRVPSTEY